MSRKKAARSKGGGSAPSAALPPPAATAPRSPAPAPELPRNGGAAPGRPSLSSSGEFYDLTFKVRGAVGKGLPGEGQAGPEQSVGCPGAWGGPRGCAVPCHYEPNRSVPCRAVRSRAIPFHAVLSAAALPAATGKVPRRWGGRRAPTVVPSPPPHSVLWPPANRCHPLLHICRAQPHHPTQGCVSGGSEGGSVESPPPKRSCSTFASGDRWLSAQTGYHNLLLPLYQDKELGYKPG